MASSHSRSPRNHFVGGSCNTKRVGTCERTLKSEVGLYSGCFTTIVASDSSGQITIQSSSLTSEKNPSSVPSNLLSIQPRHSETCMCQLCMYALLLMLLLKKNANLWIRSGMKVVIVEARSMNLTCSSIAPSSSMACLLTMVAKDCKWSGRQMHCSHKVTHFLECLLLFFVQIGWGI